MSLTIKIDKSSLVSREKPIDKHISDEENRKLTLIKPSEKAVSQKDSTDIATAMAATLCHEINNPLMTITAVTEVLLSNHKELSHGIIEKINLIAVSAERIKKATHKLIGLDSLQYCETAASRMILIDDSQKKSTNQNIKEIQKTSE